MSIPAIDCVFLLRLFLYLKWEYNILRPIFYILIFSVFQSYGQRSDFEFISFKKADSIARVNKGENLYNLPKLVYNLTEDLDTDAEKFRAIYVWVCQNIANDYGLFHVNKRKRERFKKDSIKFKNWNEKFRKRLFKKLLKDQRTICTGYAYLVKELAVLANLECEIVQGFGRVSTTDVENLTLPNHSWNAIKLNNKWYLCDPTWASGIPDPETNNFIHNYNDGFFLTNPLLFSINHYPINTKWWLLDNNIPSFKSFLASPVIYGNAYKNLNAHFYPKQMHHNIKKGEKVSFKYEVKHVINKADLKFFIDSGYNQWHTKPTMIEIDGKVINIKHLFTKKGFFDVHLYIKDELISTYTVEVKQ